MVMHSALSTVTAYILVPNLEKYLNRVHWTILAVTQEAVGLEHNILSGIKYIHSSPTAKVRMNNIILDFKFPDH